MKFLALTFGLFLALQAYANDFLSPSPMIQSDDHRIIELAESLTRNHRSDLAKSRAIHKWVAENIAFDQETAHIRNTTGRDLNPQQDALIVLQKKLAVCEGYTQITAALHRAVGIPAKVSIGKYYYFPFRLYETLKRINRVPDVRTATTLHAWNEILINNKWIPMDPTSDAGGSSGGVWVRNATLNEEFFNPDIEYFNATHLKESEFDR